MVNFPVVSEIKRVTDKKQEYFVANYYGINPFNSSERYILVLATSVRNYLPTINNQATIGIIDLKTLEFIPLSTTKTWNFQEGCMAHWVGRSDSEIIFNDFVENRYVARIINIHSGKERIIYRPVSSVSPDGKKAISLNYARRRLTRPDYGYDGQGELPREKVPFPEDDGLFLIDIDKNISRLIVSISDVQKIVGVPPNVDKKALMWFAHTLFNKDGSRIFFMARIKDKNQKRCTACFTVDCEGGNLKPCFPSPWEWGGSHYDWQSKEKLMVTALYQGRKYCPILFTDGKNDYTVLGKGLFGDGHGTFSPDGRYLVIDTYPDKFSMQDLYIMEMFTEAVLPIGSFYQPSEFYYPSSYWRCDLHPHWSGSGNFLLINSTHENSRQIYMFHLKWNEN